MPKSIQVKNYNIKPKATRNYSFISKQIMNTLKLNNIFKI